MTPRKLKTPLALPPPSSLAIPMCNAEQALNQTFAWAVFLGNGLMAILAGFFGDFLVEKMGLGRVAPFDAAIVFMLIGGAIMMATWPENYGDSSSKNLSQQFEKAWHAITTGGRVGASCMGGGEWAAPDTQDDGGTHIGDRPLRTATALPSLLHCLVPTPDLAQCC